MPVKQQSSQQNLRWGSVIEQKDGKISGSSQCDHYPRSVGGLSMSGHNASKHFRSSELIDFLLSVWM